MMRSFVLMVCLFLPALAAAQGDGELERTSRGWRWSRGSLEFELRDRGKRWSRAEAEAMDQAFDRLPDVFLRRATDYRIRWYRDGITTGRRGKRKPDAAATTVVEQRFISCGDSMIGNVNASRIYAIVIHELGHVAQYALASSNPYVARGIVVSLGTPGFTSISWTWAATDGLRSHNGFVSDYARSANREDFAESVEFYWLAPDELRRVSPRKYRFMRDRVFGGRRSPLSARNPHHHAIDPVRPHINGLNKRSATTRAKVRVSGEFFMGPLDGGYNRVYFGGRRALHLPISRTRIESWVPGRSRGSSPVHVRTQDGRSNSSSFRVSRPWWRFW